MRRNCLVKVTAGCLRRKIHLIAGEENRGRPQLAVVFTVNYIRDAI